MREIIDEIRKFNLKEILQTKFGLKFNNSNLALCPFHDDTRPSFSVRNDNGIWEWHCFGKCDTGGDYIDFRKGIDGTDFNETIKKIQSENELISQTGERNKKGNRKPIAIYIYRDEEGNPLYRKLKYKEKTYAFERLEDGKWKLGLNNTRRLLYNLPELKDSGYVFYLEGEKDCESLRELNFVATTAGSVNSWKEDFVEYFKDKSVSICLDVGNEIIAEKIALDLSRVTNKIKILQLPGLNEREQDITDWLEMMRDVSIDEKKKRLIELIKETPYYEPTISTQKPRIETLEEFLAREMPKREIIVQYHAEKEAVSILAGEHKRGKSLYATQLALRIAEGKDFLNFIVPKPRKILLYQQEISEPSMKERLTKMLKRYSPSVLENFLIKNTVGNLVKVTNSSHRKQIHEQVETYKPELIIFDPFSTFHNRKENDEKEMSEVIDYFYEIAKKFCVAVLLIHHYGKPSMVSRQGGHLLRGHSILGDRPDIIILFNRLPKKYQNSPLPYAQDNYAEVEFILRSDAKPDNLIIERDPENLWYREYDLYNQLGRKILPERVKNIIQENGGEMQQAELMMMLQKLASKQVAFNAIQEAKQRDYIESVPLKGQGNPILLKLKGREVF